MFLQFKYIYNFKYWYQVLKYYLSTDYNKSQYALLFLYVQLTYTLWD